MLWIHWKFWNFKNVLWVLRTFQKHCREMYLYRCNLNDYLKPTSSSHISLVEINCGDIFITSPDEWYLVIKIVFSWATGFDVHLMYQLPSFSPNDFRFSEFCGIWILFIQNICLLKYFLVGCAIRCRKLWYLSPRYLTSNWMLALEVVRNILSF